VPNGMERYTIFAQKAARKSSLGRLENYQAVSPG
jgi:hypothetical protein